MIIRVTYADYTTDDNDELVVRVAGRAADGSRQVLKVYGCTPYFFAPADDVVMDGGDEIVDIDFGYEAYDGKELQKIFLSHPQQTEEIREEFSDSYESDIPFYRRVSLDGLSGYIRVPRGKTKLHMSEIETDVDPITPIKPRMMIGDIEVIPDYDVDFYTMKMEAEQPIICLTLWDSFEDKYHVLAWDSDEKIKGKSIISHIEEQWESFDDKEKYTESSMKLYRCKTERSLLEKTVSIIAKIRPDIIGGWNWVDFDHQYLLRRMDNVGIKLYKLSDVGYIQTWKLDNPRYGERLIPGLPGFDMMNAYAKDFIRHNLRSKALDYVSKQELGVGKVDNIEIKKEWEKDRSRLLAYNIIDTQLCVALERKHGIHDFYFELADLCSIQISDVQYPMRRVDGYIMSNRDDDEVLPIAKEKDISKGAGALVFPPPTGVLDWVGVLDLASLYPSVIISWNISPETITTDLEESDLTIPAMPAPDDIDGHLSEDNIKWKGDGVYGTKLEEEGLIPKYLKRLFPLRDEMKSKRDSHGPNSEKYKLYDQRQYATKVLMNCFSDDTEIITPNGINKISELEIGDEVYSINPETNELEIKNVIKTVRQKNLYGELHHIQNAGIDLKVTPNHNFLVDVPPSGNRLYSPYDELEKWTRYQIPDHEPKTGKSQKWYILSHMEGDIRLYHKRHGKTFVHNLPHNLSEEVGESVKNSQNPVGQTFYEISTGLYRENVEILHEWCNEIHIQYSRKHSSVPVRYEMDDWLRLVGWYIAEGTVREYPNTNCEQVSITQKTQKYRDEIKSLLERMGIKYSSNRNGIQISNTNIKRELEKSCGRLSKERRIPEWIFNLDSSHLNALHDAMMKGDDDERGGRYSTKSTQLKEDYSRLLVHLGKKPSISRDSGVWRIRPTCTNALCKGRNESVEEHDGDVVCVTVEDNHTLLAGRNGTFQWTGQTVYGVLGQKYWRLSDEHLTGLVTAGGRYVNWKGSVIAGELGYDALYSDTDSSFFQLGDNDDDDVDSVLERGRTIESNLNERMDELATEIGVGESHPYLDENGHHGNERHMFEWEFEKLYKRYLQGGKKKRYAGHIVWKEGEYVDKTDITGFESNRSDVPQIGAQSQEEVIEGILSGEGFESISANLREYIQGMREDFDVEVHGISKSYNPPYKVNLPIVRAVDYSNEYLDYNWEGGDRPWMIYVSQTPPGLPQTDVIALNWTDDVPDGFQIDYLRMMEKCFEQPLTRVLEIAGWTWTGVKEGVMQEGIGKKANPTGNPFQ